MTRVMPFAPTTLTEGRRSLGPKTGLRSAAVLGALALSFACVALDNSKLALAVPTLARALRATPGVGLDVRWIVEANLVVYTALLLVGGAASERIGARRASMFGLGLFMAGSCAAAAAGSTLALFAARAVVGAGAALMTPASLAGIQQAFQGADRARAIAIWTASFAAAMALGPLIGGVLLERWGFSALMVSHVPLAALSLYGVFEFVPAGAAPERQSGSRPPLGDPDPFERRLGLLSIAPFRRALLVILLSYFAFSGLGFAIAQYWQVVRLHAPSAASLWNLPQPLALLAGTLAAPALMRRWGTSRALAGSLAVAFIGAVLVTVGAFLQSDLALCVALVPFAAGAGSAFPNATEAIASIAPPARAGTAAALSETAFELGGVLGIGALGTPFHGSSGAPAPAGAAAWAGAAAALAFALASSLTAGLTPSPHAPRGTGHNALKRGRSWSQRARRVLRLTP
jgi:MFS transporter, DHA2 family, multidrug resistance protein